MSPDQIEEIAEAVADRIVARTETRPLYTTQTLAERLNVSERFARKLLEGPSPVIQSFKLGGARRVDPAAVDAYLAARRDDNS